MAPPLWLLTFISGVQRKSSALPTATRVKTSTGYLLHHKWCNIVTSD